MGGGGGFVVGNAHFLPRMSYYSQKSCVKIWFGLVEMEVFNFQGKVGCGVCVGGGRSPLLEGGYM